MITVKKSKKIDTIKDRIEKGYLKPYDGYSPMELFLEVLASQPALKESLDCQLELNHDWVEKATAGQIFFILNENAWKRKDLLPFVPKLKLTFVGKENSPTISIDL